MFDGNVSDIVVRSKKGYLVDTTVEMDECEALGWTSKNSRGRAFCSSYSVAGIQIG